MNFLISKILNNRLLSQTFRLSIITLVSNVLGFLVPIYIAYLYGISKQTDDFFLSYGVITFVNVIFSTAISSVTVPFVKEKMGDKEWVNSFFSSFFSFCIKYVGLAVSIAIIILIIINAVSGSRLVFFLAISTPILLFTVLNAFCYGILNSMERYNVAAMSPLSRALIIFVTIYFFNSSLGVVAVILGYNLGELCKLFHLLYVLRSKVTLKINLLNDDFSLIRNFIKEGSYQAISTAVSCASPLIDKIVASFLIVGSLSVLDYGDKVVLVFGILLNAFLVIILGKWSSEFVNRTFDLKKMIKILLLIFCSSTVIFFLVILTKPIIVHLLYPTLELEKQDLIGMIILLSMGGFIFNSINQVINMANIAFKATAVLVKTSVFKAIINLILDIIFGLKWGVIGIAFATVIVHLAGLIVNFIVFRYTVYSNYLMSRSSNQNLIT